MSAAEETQAVARPPKPVVQYREDWLDQIPAELKTLKQWVVWRYEWKEPGPRSKGKWTKILYQPAAPVYKALHNQPRTWTKIDAALRAFRNEPDVFAGIGFVFSPTDPYCGIDFDACINPDGSLADWARPHIERLGNAYGEISPSGTGIKFFVRAELMGTGTKKSKFGPDGKGAIEMYDQLRFFTTTGNAWGDTRAMEDRQEAVDALYAFLKTPPEKKPDRPRMAKTPDDATIWTIGGPLTDEELLRKARGSANGAKFSALYDRGELAGHPSDSEADMDLCNMLAFWTGCAEARMERLWLLSALGQRPKTQERADYRAVTIAKAIEGCKNVYTGLSPRARAAKAAAEGFATEEGLGGGGQKEPAPEILIGTDEHRVVDQTVRALRSAPELYVKGSLLVRVRRSTKERKGFKNTMGMPTIEIVPTPQLRKIISRDTYLLREVETKTGIERKEAHPPDWLVRTVESEAEYPGFRDLVGVTEAPTIRPDGTILSEPGYDEATGLILAPHTDFPTVPENPTREDARKASEKLLAIVADFPFKGPEHRAVWLAAVLTMFARHAIDGPCPLFLFNANVRGAGKSKLCDSISILATGRDMARSPYPDDDDELQKMLLSVALAGDQMLLFDNLASGSSIGGPALDRTITSATIKGRILGLSKMSAELPNLAVYFATGNNIGAKGDALRRILIGWLNSDQERPEERDDFAIQGDLLDHVRAHRGELAVAAVTILRAHALAGWPAEKLTPMDFTAWNKLVRHAVHWATGHDPAATREEARESDQDSVELAALIGGLEVLCRVTGRTRLTSNEIVREVKKLAEKIDAAHDGRPRVIGWPNGVEEEHVAILAEDIQAIERFRDAITEWSPKGDIPTARLMGNRLNKLRGRVCDRKSLHSDPVRGGYTAWRVRLAGDSGDSGDSGFNPSRAGEDISSSCISDGIQSKPEWFQQESPESPESPPTRRKGVL